MAQQIKIKPYKNGTAIVTVSLTDENNIPLTFAQVSNPRWQLSRKDGTSVNNRTYDNSDLDSFVWEIHGDDLTLINGDDSLRRFITFKCEYDSSEGNDLPLIAECEFKIQNTIG